MFLFQTCVMAFAAVSIQKHPCRYTYQQGAQPYWKRVPCAPFILWAPAPPKVSARPWCSVNHFCVVFEVCVWIIVRLEDPNMAHYKIYNRVSHLLIFYLLVFDRIHDAMCLNKMSRTSSRNIGPQHQKYSSIFHCTHGVLFIPVFTKPILSVCC